MADPTRGEIAQSAKLPKKQFITEEELLELWDTRGLKFRVDDLFKHLRERGLVPHYKKDIFRKRVLSMLRAFLVEGEIRLDPRFVPPLKPLKRV
jgi:hypothetical protein